MHKSLKALVVSIASVSVMMPFTVHAGGAASNNKVVMDKRGNVITNTFGNCVRTKWDHGTDHCNPPAPVAAPAPVMPPPQPPRTYAAPPPRQPVVESRAYLVFFDFDKSSITSEASNIIRTAYSEGMRPAQSVQFTVIGHADRSGSDKYNMALSERRANQVSKELIRLGVPSQNIQVDFRGEREPLVPTDDGVREPQNRRAEIKYHSVR